MSSDQQFTSSSASQGHSDWNDCPQGELARMVRKLDATRARAQTRKLVQTGLLSVLLVAGGVVVGGSLFTQNAMTLGGITCAECQSHFAAYHGHVTGSELLEDLGLATSMATHLASCQRCQGQFNKNYPGVLEDEISISPPPTIRSPLPLLAVSHQPAFF